MLTEFTLHANLDQVTLKQNSIVLADEPTTHQCQPITTITPLQTTDFHLKQEPQPAKVQRLTTGKSCKDQQT